MDAIGTRRLALKNTYYPGFHSEHNPRHTVDDSSTFLYAQISYAAWAVPWGNRRLLHRPALRCLPWPSDFFRLMCQHALRNRSPAYALGYGLSPSWWWGPLADRFGRRRSRLCGVTLFTLAAWGCLGCLEFGAFCLLRLSAGCRRLWHQRVAGLPPGWCSASAPWPRRCPGGCDQLCAGLVSRPFLGVDRQARGSWRADFVSSRLGLTRARLPWSGSWAKTRCRPSNLPCHPLRRRWCC